MDGLGNKKNVMEKNDLLLVVALAVGGYALWSYTKKKEVPTDSTETATTTTPSTIDVLLHPSHIEPPQSSVAFEGDALPEFGIPFYIEGNIKSGLPNNKSSFN